ncbi:MAG: acetyl-CoA decarbonylase/synthase complex subunit delta [Spirochaetes bacterium RBG_16_49_21]|nr:MAG: acetyl-CoA decarbonylase/synthase complex subunit delta [Spirochaetes bacterium RBG_16_49_21]
MAFEAPKIDYTGKIKEITLGTGNKAVKVGGSTSYPFYLFEGQMPNPPRIAMEVFDFAPDDWAEAAVEPFKDVIGDPVAWAKKNIQEYGAEMIALQLRSIDPNGLNRSANEAAATAKRVIDAVDVPVILWGVANHEKDTEVLRLIAESCEGKNLALGPVEEEDYKQIGASAIAYKHTVIASSPIDINLAKQLNILLDNLGVPGNKIIVDPTTGALGYGLEYTYSVMERDRMAALTQEDEKLQYPLICNVGYEVWKTKEAKMKTGDDIKFGDSKKRGIIMECVTAMSLLLAGADILIMRHPESIKLIRKMITDLAS